MGTIIIVAWLLAVIVGLVALIRRFDFEARDQDTRFQSTASTFERSASKDVSAQGNAREGESVK